MASPGPTDVHTPGPLGEPQPKRKRPMLFTDVLEKFNRNHGKDGKFSSGGASGGAVGGKFSGGAVHGVHPPKDVHQWTPSSQSRAQRLHDHAKAGDDKALQKEPVHYMETGLQAYKYALLDGRKKVRAAPGGVGDASLRPGPNTSVSTANGLIKIKALVGQGHTVHNAAQAYGAQLAVNTRARMIAETVGEVRRGLRSSLGGKKPKGEKKAEEMRGLYTQIRDLQKFNTNHGSDGRFSSGSSGGVNRTDPVQQLGEIHHKTQGAGAAQLTPSGGVKGRTPFADLGAKHVKALVESGHLEYHDHPAYGRTVRLTSKGHGALADRHSANAARDRGQTSHKA